MQFKSDNPGHGFQFPGIFELSAMGASNKELQTVLPKLLAETGVRVLDERVNWTYSSNGKYISVRIVFQADSREQHAAAYRALSMHPEVKWTL